MKKKPVFGKIILGLYFMVLTIISISTFQIKQELRLKNQDTLLQKILYQFPIQVKMNQKINSIDNAEVILKDRNFTDKISAPNSKYGYEQSYKPIDENSKIAYFSINIQNLTKRKQQIDKLLKGQLIYDQKYELDCSALKETKDRTDFTENIELMPLQRENVYLICEIPKNFVMSKKSMFLNIYIGNHKYIMRLR